MAAPNKPRQSPRTLRIPASGSFEMARHLCSIANNWLLASQVSHTVQMNGIFGEVSGGFGIITPHRAHDRILRRERGISVRTGCHSIADNSEQAATIPKGLRPPAQGCEERATLGKRWRGLTNPNRQPGCGIDCGARAANP